MHALWKEIRHNPLLWLLAFVPVVLVAEGLAPDRHTLLFVLSVLAIVPLAALLSHATESVAAKTGDTVGGLLNATLGNLTELVIAVGDTSESFFYNWSELTLAPAEWFRSGIVTQRTRAYEAERELQRGFLFGFSGDPVELTMCVFNPDDDQPVFVVGFGASF